MLNFQRLQPPPDDGDFLIEPPPDRWPALIAENVKRRTRWSFFLAGEPAEAAIAATRSSLRNGPVVACGHQPAFVHPGVWAKHVVVRRADEQLGVNGLDFVVDNDAPRSSGLTVPTVTTDGQVSPREIVFTDAPAGSAYEGRSTMSTADLKRIRKQLEEALGKRMDTSMLATYVDGLSSRLPDGDAVDQHIAGREAVDRIFGAHLPEARVSRAFGGPFLADLLLNAERFAAAYNAALASYRREQNVTSANRPLPDLGRHEDRIETALWIYQPLHPRRRLWVRMVHDRVELFADQSSVGTLGARELSLQTDASLEALRPWVVRPRALTLTLWARLLACDFFVHGIGGAKYDRITDGIIRLYYACEPPAYACVSATLRLPLPVFDVNEATWREARRRLRDWHYNPQRYLEAPPGELMAERQRLIQRSQGLRANLGPRSQRRQVHHAIREVNEQLTRVAPNRANRLQADIDRVRDELESNAAARSREYFYCLQPRNRLEGLAERLREAW
jgi:hypothetical protein